MELSLPWKIDGIRYITTYRERNLIKLYWGQINNFSSVVGMNVISDWCAIKVTISVQTSYKKLEIFLQ